MTDATSGLCHCAAARLRAAALFTIVAMVAFSVLAAPKMPLGFVATNRDDSGLTWAETGTIGLGFAEATARIKSSMRTQGYKLKHEIFEKSLPVILFFLWQKGAEEVIVMAWTIDFRTSGISWGLSAKEGAAAPVPVKKEKK